MLTTEQRQHKNRIANNWLPRYTGSQMGEFGEYILLTNFHFYIEEFARLAEKTKNIKHGQQNTPMSCVHAGNISMINFGIGAPNAALVADLLSVVNPKAVLFLGKCGGLLDRNRIVNIGDYILPTAAIRGEGTSDHFYPKEVPALPSFAIQKEAANVIEENHQIYHSGTVYTTNLRLWEHDDHFKEYLRQLRCIGIEMETAALFIACFANHIPHGALLMVSDLPLVKVKTEEADKVVTTQYAPLHVAIGIETLSRIAASGKSMRYLTY